MRQVFADTGYYLALTNAADAWHEAAIRWTGRADLQVVTSEFVMLEVGNSYSKPPQRREFPIILQTVRASPNTRLVLASSELFNQAAQLFAQRPDKGWSLVDCSSFVLMERFKLKEALTPDHHFEQAGFRALLR